MKHSLKGRIADLEAMLAAREGKLNFAENAAEIRIELERLKAELAARDGTPAG